MSKHRSPLIHPRDEIMATMERIYSYRMTTTSGGNISIREPNGDIWITPARVDKGSLRREDIVCVKADGTVVGLHPPSSEFPFHKAAYEARVDFRAIVHAHPVALVAFSICREVPNTRLLHQARSVCGNVGIAKYALPGSKALGNEIAKTFAKGFDCVILENHGVVVGGEDLQHAFQRFETLEFTAKTIIKASTLDDVQYLTDDQIAMPRQRVKPLPFFHRSPVAPLSEQARSENAATSDEKELRKRLVEFVRRGYEHRLLISTEGSFSARIDADSFLITPYRVDRNTVDIDDIVLVRDGAQENGKTASRAARNHAAIYKRHPKFNAIVNAYTVNATAFSVSGTRLDSRTIPESYVFLRDVSHIPYGVQFTDPEKLATHFSREAPIAILENDGVLVCGTTILDAFDRLEVLESTAEAVINARHLGEIAPMDETAIDDLKVAFFGAKPKKRQRRAS